MSSRWGGRGDVLALTVGDSDFRPPPQISAAIERRLQDDVLGYDTIPEELTALISTRLYEKYHWQVAPEWFVFLPGVVQGINLCCRGLTAPGEGVISETPVYYPFLEAPANSDRTLVSLPARLADGRWQFDAEGLEKLAAVPENRLLLLCNPQNPLGRVLGKSELSAIADICVANDVVICSDEIHCDVLFDDRRHYPLAALDPAYANNSVTLMSPSKAFAISGLGGAFAIIPNPAIRQRFESAGAGLISNINDLALAAMLAAYADCEDWLQSELGYLQSNRDFLFSRLQSIPGVSLTCPEAAYFLWLDISATGLNDAYQTLYEGGVELSAGGKFGDESFLRLNFASPRSVLEEALQRIEAKLSA